VLTGVSGRSSFETRRYTKYGHVLDVRISASRYHDHESKPAACWPFLPILPNARKPNWPWLSRNNNYGCSRPTLDCSRKRKKRIAGELHDGIGQSLTALRFRLERAFSQPQQDPSGPQHESLLQILLVIRNLIEEVHKISMDLRPSILDDLGYWPPLSGSCENSRPPIQAFMSKKMCSSRKTR